MLWNTVGDRKLSFGFNSDLSPECRVKLLRDAAYNRSKGPVMARDIRPRNAIVSVHVRFGSETRDEHSCTSQPPAPNNYQYCLTRNLLVGHISN